jgi:triosephosphate isomerase
MGHPLIIGNWKMHLTLSEALILAGQAAKTADTVKHVEIVICPSAGFIYPTFEFVKARPRNLTFGIQNAAWEEEGQFTGENSLLQFKGICKYVIVGHSERRKIFNETDDEVNKKTEFALRHGFIPIVCVGEQERFHLEDHYQSELKRMKEQGGIISQIEKALEGIPKDLLENVVLAYEPIWAIGTGNVSSGAYAASIAYIIKSHLSAKFGENVAQNMKVVYGGSTASDNVREFMMQPDIDGLLVGGSSLKGQDFNKICTISSEVKSGRSI